MRAPTTAEHKAARRRMSYVTPENCPKVLSKSAYWTRQFLDLYVERCDEAGSHHPREGYVLSRQVPELAARIRVGDEPGDFKSETEKTSARVIALAVAGSCARSFGHLDEAELSLKWAADLAESSRVTSRAACELVRRTAALKYSCDAEDTETWIDRAVELADRLQDTENLVDALVLQGLFLSEAGRGGGDRLARGVSLADLKTLRGRRAFEAAVHNMALGAVRSGNLVEAARWLKRAKRQMARRPGSIQKARVIWLEGYFSGELGATRYGVRQLEKVRMRFLEMAALPDFVLCSIDLLDLHMSEGDDAAVQRSIDATVDAFKAGWDHSSMDLKGFLQSYTEVSAGLPERGRVKAALASTLQAL